VDAQVTHNAQGHFVKGHNIHRPVGGSNIKNTVAKKMLAAVTENLYTPDQLAEMLRDTYQMAVKKEDWKGMYSVIQLILSYSIGKPVQRSVTAQLDPEDIKRMFAPNEEEGEEYIEAE
jgi:hypothetical protein